MSAPRRPIAYLIVSAGLLIGAIAIGTGYLVAEFRDRELQNNERELRNTALIVAEQLDRSFQAVELVQRSVLDTVASQHIASSEELSRAMAGQDVHRVLADRVSGLAQVGSVTIINAQGKLINFSRYWPVPDADVTDRDYFKALQGDPSLNSFASRPAQNRGNGTETIFLTRRIVSADGNFLGLVLGAVELGYFEKMFGAISLGKGGSVSLFRADGLLLARYPRIESAIGRVYNAGLDALGERGEGTARFVGKMDGLERILAVHRLSHFPFYIAVGRDVDLALAAWRQQTKTLLGVGILGALAIGLIMLFAARHLRRNHQWSQQRLALQKQRLVSAINSMPQGLVLFDADERLVVCNKRYLELYDLSEEDVRPGCSYRDVIAARARAQGDVEDVEGFCVERRRRMREGRPFETLNETEGGRAIRVVNHPADDGGWVSIHEDITERMQSEQRIAHLAHHDALTGLPNRVLFRERLEQDLRQIEETGGQLALLYLDLDHFKGINDSLGHPVGDELLKYVAERLLSCIGASGFVARLGGDEFAIVQNNLADPAEADALASRIFATLGGAYEVATHRLMVEGTIGIALSPQHGSDPDELLKNADLAMYAAKADGRGKFRVFESAMDARIKERSALEFDLREAIMVGGFELHFQPLVHFQDDYITGCEALLRWHHRTRGMIPPSDFIPIAEETGLIGPLGEWVLRTACEEAASWPDDMKVAVNVSPVQFGDSLVQTVVSALASSQLPPHRLELEITEAVLIRDDSAALEVLHRLRSFGVRIALDDFGTGYSSLSYLQRFPFDKIKIDRSFVRGIAESDYSRDIVRAIVDIAKTRRIITTAEGVETERQRDVLHALGCTEMQGYLFSPPVPSEQLAVIVSPRRRAVARAS